MLHITGLALSVSPTVAMNENDYIEELNKHWPQKGDATIETIALADEATRAFPRSPKLWCMRGNLIECGPENTPHSLDEALASYKRAIEIDLQFIEGWEDIGYFYQNVLDKEDEAKPYFHKAERLKGYHDPISARAVLRREFDAQEGSFIFQARCHYEWDWDAFRSLTSAMYDVADEARGSLLLRPGSRRGGSWEIAFGNHSNERDYARKADA